MNAAAVSKSSPLSVITNLIADSALQVERITGAVLAGSNLRNEMTGLIQSTTKMQEKLTGLSTDERDCLTILGDVHANRLGHMIEFQSLSEEAMDRLRRRLSIRLTAHLAAIRRNKVILERGIELGRAAMVSRFALFAVGGLSQDSDPLIGRARAFVITYLVATRLKDHLQTAGFRWAGEKTLISLYLNAIACERRQSRERSIADPISSLIASTIGFVSAMSLHQCLYQWHRTLLGEQPLHAPELVRFPALPGLSFEQGYYKMPTPEEEFHQFMQRTRKPFPARPAHAAGSDNL